MLTITPECSPPLRLRASPPRSRPSLRYLALSASLSVASFWCLSLLAASPSLLQLRPSSAGKAFELVSNPLACTCSDVAPRRSFLAAEVEYTCLQQADFGNCEQTFMSTAVEELDEGYCEISCGRCSCCAPFSNVLKDKGLNLFKWMLDLTGEYGNLIQKPGFMATLLAPSDDAVRDAIQKLGFKSSSDVDEGAKKKLADAAKRHILPPVSDSKALWSAPFMTGNVWIPSALPGHGVSASTDSDGRVKLSSDHGSVHVVTKDIDVCKGFIEIVDGVMLENPTN